MTMIRFPRLRDEDGFTLIEMLVGMVILVIIMGSIGGALIVGLKTTDQTTVRFSESHDAQIAAAYLANDVQSALSITNTTCGPGGALISFTYDGAKGVASYYYGAGSNGETQVTRTFCNASGAHVSDVVVAHFAGGIPIVKCDGGACASGSQPDKVEISFTEQSGYAFSLLGTRRINLGGGPTTPPPPDLTLLATGSSPLWVLGGCKANGANADCVVDLTKPTNALPIADLATSGWTTLPLWEKLSDGSDTTFVVNNPGNQNEAKVQLAPVPPPAAGTFPTIDVRARVGAYATTDGIKEWLTATLYDGAKSIADAKWEIDRTGIGDYVYTLNNGENSRLTSDSYAHLSIGFAMSTGGATENIDVFGVALDTLIADTSALGNPSLTVDGNLYVNSTDPNAVRLSGTKTTKLIITGAAFGTLAKDATMASGGGCNGCSDKTVTCTTTTTCVWNPVKLWTPATLFYPEIPDPLRFMTAPPETGPNTYVKPTLRVNAGETLNLQPGIYILKNGMSVAGNATVNGSGVMLFNEAGNITFSGGAHLNLSAPTSGQYKGILIFQCGGTPGTPTCSNPSEISLSGGVSVNNPASILGMVYAPAADKVTLGIGGAFLHVSAVVARNIVVTGNSQVTIGG